MGYDLVEHHLIGGGSILGVLYMKEIIGMLCSARVWEHRKTFKDY